MLKKKVIIIIKIKKISKLDIKKGIIIGKSKKKKVIIIIKVKRINPNGRV